MYACLFYVQHTYICVYDGAFSHFNPLIASQLYRVLLHTLQPPFEHVLSNTNLYKTRRHARMNGGASDSRDIRRRRCNPEGYAIGLSGRGFLCSFCPLRMHTRRPSLRSGYPARFFSPFPPPFPPLPSLWRAPTLSFAFTLDSPRQFCHISSLSYLPVT